MKSSKQAAAVNPGVSVKGTSSKDGAPTADFGKAGANVVGSSAPSNYKAGSGKSKSY
jgi:hypothetical protein